MHYYHENCHASYYDGSNADGAREDLGPREHSCDDRTFEPIRAPAGLTWVVIVYAALCAIVAAES